MRNMIARPIILGNIGTNDNGYSYDITGIGIEKSRQ